MSDEYEYESADADYADTHDGDPAAPAESADDTIYAETPSGFDYRANPTAKVSDVMQISEHLASQPETLPDGWFRDEHGYLWDDEEIADLQAAHAQQQQAEQRAAADDQRRLELEVSDWVRRNPEVGAQAAAWAAQVNEEQRQLENHRAATAAANQPLEDVAQALLDAQAGQAQDEAVTSTFQTWSDSGVRDVGRAWEIANQLHDHLVASGAQLGPADAEAIVEAVGEYVALEDSGVVFDENRAGDVRPRPAKLTGADFEERFGGYLPVGQGRPSVTSMFFGGKGR